MKRFLAVVISVLLFAMIYSTIGLSSIPFSERETSIYNSSVITLVIIFAGPAYVLAGLPVSILIDKFIGKYDEKSNQFRYVFSLTLYSIAGVMIGYFYILLLFQVSTWWAPLLGLIASHIYFHLMHFFSKYERMLKEF